MLESNFVMIWVQEFLISDHKINTVEKWAKKCALISANFRSTQILAGCEVFIKMMKNNNPSCIFQFLNFLDQHIISGVMPTTPGQTGFVIFM